MVLGAPVKNYDAVVLLCKKKDGETLPFILPRDFFMDVRNHLSVNANQFKFNISSSNGDFFLSVPSEGKSVINLFLLNTEYLRSI